MNCLKSIFLVSLLFLSACDTSPPEALLEEYLQRMSNVLDTEIPDNALQTDPLPTFPEKRDRTLTTTDVRQGLWEVLDFRQCNMLNIIAERNSSLGKVMLPSQKMAYEFRFIQALQQCQLLMSEITETGETTEAFIERLDEIHQTKRSNLPSEVWNGIYASDEMAKQFKLGATPLPLPSKDASTNELRLQPVMQKLTYLATLSGADTIELPVWLTTIEEEYAQLHHSQFGSQAIATLPLISAALNQVAEAIERRLERKPFCYKGHQPQRATVLMTVFQKYYIGQVQPYMASIEQQVKPWLAAHSLIIEQLPATDAMKQYASRVISLSNTQSLWQQWVFARNRHTKAWQTILAQCNMMPGM